VKQFRGLKSWLEAQPAIAKYIDIIPEEDRGVTGNFEVRIGDERQLIHSKKTAGQGRAESTKERQMIAEFIQEYLNDNVL
jgi:hypothetical protein